MDQKHIRGFFGVIGRMGCNLASLWVHVHTTYIDIIPNHIIGMTGSFRHEPEALSL